MEMLTRREVIELGYEAHDGPEFTGYWCAYSHRRIWSNDKVYETPDGYVLEEYIDAYIDEHGDDDVVEVEVIR